jgi:hypothetical protein
MKKSWMRAAGALAAGFLLLGGLSACSQIAKPDEVGLYYMEGPDDGYKFDHCFDPGSTTDAIWNNSVVHLPTSLRTWNITHPNQGGDSDVPITVSAAPEANQPSGVQVNVYTQTNFMLNTNCDAGASSPVVQFWEKIGRRYNAEEVGGWKTMLQNTVVTALTTATRNVVRTYNADVLVAGTANVEVQQKISAAFAPELKRLVGGDFFCGPTFNRASTACPAVETILVDVDYTNPGIQAARDEKQKAIELAAAKVAEAEGQVKAAAAQAQLYNNPAWVQLQLAQLQLEQVRACASNPNCTVVVGADGVITSK